MEQPRVFYNIEIDIGRSKLVVSARIVQEYPVDSRWHQDHRVRGIDFVRLNERLLGPETLDNLFDDGADRIIADEAHKARVDPHQRKRYTGVRYRAPG